MISCVFPANSIQFLIGRSLISSIETKIYPNHLEMHLYNSNFININYRSPRSVMHRFICIQMHYLFGILGLVNFSIGALLQINLRKSDPQQQLSDHLTVLNFK